MMGAQSVMQIGNSTCRQKALDVGKLVRLAQAAGQYSTRCRVFVIWHCQDGFVGLFVKNRHVSLLYCYD